MKVFHVLSLSWFFLFTTIAFILSLGDAQSERQTSIYSPAFYSSPVGYKMRARLYLNGDGNARRTHLSLFFVLMRGPNDAVLKFPFNYKVTFCLYDQTPAQKHIIDSFRPDIRSSSFQRPRSEMNIASGIPKFFPLVMIQQEGNPYVRDDTMFIKVVVDFGDIPKTLVPFAMSLNPGLPSSVQHEMIREEAERRAQLQSSQQQ
jgi:TNF receptor-associated factor 2